MRKKRSRKFQKSFIYTKLGKIYEEELTYDKFIEGLKGSLEFAFIYKGTSIDISFFYEKGQKVYELSINGYTDHATRCLFHSVDDLVEAKKFEGKNIKEIWGDLEN